VSASAPAVTGWPYVLYWWPVRDQDAGVEWYRVELPLKEYSRRGGRCSRSHSNVLTPESLSLADVIVGGYRRITPEYARAWLELCERSEKRMVFDIDDDFFSAPEHFQTSRPAFRAPLESLIRASHVVTVTTSVLAERLSPLSSNVYVVPNRVPSWLTECNHPQAPGLTVGWAGGESHEWDWVGVAPQLGRFLTQHPDVGFHAMGHWDWDAVDTSDWPLSRVRRSGWSPDVEVYYRSIDFDIGVAPLAPEPFNQAKSAIKALEYAALGIPVVASACGPYVDFVKHRETGFLVDLARDRNWVKFLHALAAHADLRAEMGTNARRQATDHTIEENLESWLVPWGVEVEHPQT